jgi:hypothetical protein
MRKRQFIKKPLKENLSSEAAVMEQDHEVQMARSDCYKIAKYAIELHKMLANVSEQEGLEGWVQAKITKSADYMSSVKHHLEYDMLKPEIDIQKVERPAEVPTELPSEEMPVIEPQESIKGE